MAANNSANKSPDLREAPLPLTRDQERLIFEALGAASMCWEPRPTGIFDSSLAEMIGKRLCAALASQPDLPEAPDLRERLARRILVKDGGTGDPWRDHWNLTENDSLLHKDALAALASQRDSRPSSVDQVESDSKAVQRPVGEEEVTP